MSRFACHPATSAFVRIKTPRVVKAKPAMGVLDSLRLIRLNFESRLDRQVDTNKLSFLANRGKLHDTLNRDIPRVFSQAPDLQLFCPSMSFAVDFTHNHIHYQASGLKHYGQIFDALRWSARLLLRETHVEHHFVPGEVESEVVVRFRVSVLPVVSLFSSSHPIVLQGLSTYYLDDEGMVHTHRITDVERSDRHATAPDECASPVPSWVCSSPFSRGNKPGNDHTN